MKLICLDLEGVLVPEIWIAFSQAAEIPELARTTRDEPDYDKLMAFRLDILDKHRLKLSDIQKVIGALSPLPGALEFADRLRAKTQMVVLSDTFEQFAKPLMEKLKFPTLFCNTLELAVDGRITGWKLRQKNGKKCTVAAFQSCNIEVFAAGDSFNDIAMIKTANSGCLFRAPPAIRKSYSNIPCVDTFEDFEARIDLFLS
ncbi:MAG: bifunctional phosphoserine phosphatase/homoserine phosphotransferase ThrH [Spirochaetaceae bacterium]|jgi:phosphoserine/homoserine phosphotransferase|nr:bifunctional phosphoserine phosphatase/homoserine phosphotransferase ThrH [Spirochaetaceae bacterium]